MRPERPNLNLPKTATTESGWWGLTLTIPIIIDEFLSLSRIISSSSFNLWHTEAIIKPKGIGATECNIALVFVNWKQFLQVKQKLLTV
jgi:hypothetical protein